MTTREIFDAYFKNGDEFLYVPDRLTQHHFQIRDIQPNQLEIAVCRTSLPNRPFTYFFKVNGDVPYIYKVIQNFKR